MHLFSPPDIKKKEEFFDWLSTMAELDTLGHMQIYYIIYQNNIIKKGLDNLISDY